MGKEILVLTGSPRRKGNSDQLADALIAGAVSAGLTAHKFETAYKEIHGCRGCNMCWSTGTEPCVIKDDFFQIVPFIEKCETVVFASPLYFLMISAQLKLTLDRFHAYCRGEGKKRIAIKESVLLLTVGDTDDETFKHAVGAYKDISNYFGWNDRGIIVAKGVNGKTDIQTHEALEQAAALGRLI